MNDNDIDKINQHIINAINIIVDNRIANLQLDQTFRSTIFQKNPNHTYKILYMGQEYDVPCAMNIELKVGQNVWVKIPSGVLRNMHICGVINN